MDKKIYIWANLSKNPSEKEINMMNDGKLILLKSETFDHCFQYNNPIQFVDSIQSQIKYMIHKGFDVTLVSTNFAPATQLYLGMTWNVCEVAFITPTSEWLTL